MCMEGVGREKEKIKARMALRFLLWVTGLLMPFLKEKFEGKTHLELC